VKAEDETGVRILSIAGAGQAMERGRLHACRWRAAALLLLILVPVSAGAEVPVGWRAAEEPADSTVAALDNGSLVDRLASETAPGVGTRRAVAIERFLPLRPAEEPGPPASPVLTEIVRRGLPIVPTLLEHLTDGRPTRIVLDPAELALGGSSGPFTNVYDYRFHQGGTRPANVNSSTEAAPTGQWPYTVRVGDLCFVALGQIVNRRYFVVGPDFGNGQAYDGIVLLEINSPVERPELAAAARADWGRMTAQEFVAQLTGEAEHEVPSAAAPVGSPEDYLPAISWSGALERLLYYYPDAGTQAAEAMLGRPPAETDSRASAQKATLVRRGSQEQLLQTLDAFDWTTLHPLLWELFQAAADEEHELAPARSLGEGLGTDLPLALGARLIHLGHDKELEAFFTEAVVRMIREYPQAIAEQEREMAGAVRSFAAGGASEGESLRHNYMLETAHLLLRDPIQARISLLHRLGIDGYSIPPDP
jgi:hypothetical protein